MASGSDQPTAQDPIPVGSCLVLGGARSGKSRHAEALALAAGRHAVYIATAQAWDDEMAARVALHRERRAGAGWRTVEEPLDLPGVLRREVAPDRVVLVDCLTLWLTNVMLAEQNVAAAVEELSGLVSGLPGPVVYVSNEVGGGIVPDNALARRFRDEQGRLNQMMAQACAGVVLVAAGLPLVLKPTPQAVPALVLG